MPTLHHTLVLTPARTTAHYFNFHTCKGDNTLALLHTYKDDNTPVFDICWDNNTPVLIHTYKDDNTPVFGICKDNITLVSAPARTLRVSAVRIMLARLSLEVISMLLQLLHICGVVEYQHCARHN